MQAASADPKGQEPTPAGLRRSRLKIGVREHFAQNMSNNIIQSIISQMEMEELEADCRGGGAARAEELASAVVEVALRDHLSQRSAGVKVDGGQEMDPGKESQTSKVTKPFHPSLSQSGLPAVGSLDYPDAPPTSPLLPELQRSRHSFARKLKRGLATVFLPSPPPPTPKDKEDGAADPRVELMEHLMHSLSTDVLTRDCHHGAKMEAFAEALSRDVINWALSDGTRTKIADDSDFHLLAHQLAETIISSSLHEATKLV